MRSHLALAAAAALLAGCANAPLARGDAAREQVAAAERAFAKTMADRDFAAFGTFVADDAVFFAGGTKALHGKAEVTAAWKRLYEQRQAPFSWEPKIVEVLADGTLALSSGPVHDPLGKVVGCFSSIWRQESGGRWQVVFDRGTGPQECDKP